VSLLSAPMIVDRHPDPNRSLTLTTCPGVPRLTDGFATANRACSGGAIRPFRGRGEPTVLLEGSARADLYAGVLTMVSASGWQAGRLASDPTVSSSKPAGQPAAGDASSASFADGRRRSSLPLMKAALRARKCRATRVSQPKAWSSPAEQEEKISKGPW
jgi:hypothetical protein